MSSDNQCIAFGVVWSIFLKVKEGNPSSWDVRLGLSHRVVAERFGKNNKHVTDLDTDCKYGDDTVEDGEGPGYNARTFWTLDDGSGSRTISENTVIIRRKHLGAERQFKGA